MSNPGLVDATGRQRSPAATPGHWAGCASPNKGQRYPADPPTVEEIILVMRQARPGPYADRTRGLIAILWRAGLRLSEALAVTETDLDSKTGSVLVRVGKGRLCRIRHSRPYVAPGTMLRLRLWWRPRAGIVACQLNIVWAGSETLQEREKGVGRPVATGFAVGRRGAVKCAAFEVHVGVDVLVGGVERLVTKPQRDRRGIDRLRCAEESHRRRCHITRIQHAHLGITSIYLQGIDTREIVDTVHHRRPPVIPASAGLRP